MLPELPVGATRILSAISAFGGRGYLVGGALRDLMMDRNPKDWDFACTLTPKRLLEIFPGSQLIGGDCGTVQVQTPNGSCEITPCRSESGYSDRRHPDRVIFVPDILADLSRRDFTVNAMAYDGRILFDPFGGQQDIGRRLLRCVGRPEERFAEDPLRILRLFRLAAQLGFTAEWNTYCTASAAMNSIAELPRERVGAEIRRILMSAGPQVLGGIIAKGGLQSYGFNFAPALGVLAEVPRTPICRWWALSALCGADIDRVADRFDLSKKNRGQLAECTRLYRLGPAAGSTELKMKLRNTALDYAPIAATFAAVSPAFSAEPAWYSSVCTAHEPYRLCELAVTGDMLRCEGIQGERCGQVLDELLLAVIKNPALNRPQILLGLARSLKQLL